MFNNLKTYLFSFALLALLIVPVRVEATQIFTTSPFCHNNSAQYYDPDGQAIYEMEEAYLVGTDIRMLPGPLPYLTADTWVEQIAAQTHNAFSLAANIAMGAIQDAWDNPDPLAFALGVASVPTMSGRAAFTPCAKGGIQNGTKVFRVWGDKSGPWGKSWTTVNPNTVRNLRSAAGLPDVNSGRFISEGVLRSTEGITSRGALIIKSGQQGGLPELVIKNAEEKVLLQRVIGVNPEF